MFEGKIISTDDPSIVKFFEPSYLLVRELPLYGDNYIICRGVTPSVFRKRFQKSILIHPSGVPLNKDLLLNQVDMGKKAREALEGLPEQEFLSALKVYVITGKVNSSIDLESSTYQLLKSFLDSKQKLCSVYFELVRDRVPAPVVFSSFLTFLTKAKNVDDISGLNPIYRKDLNLLRMKVDFGRVSGSIQIYLRSEKGYLALLNFFLAMAS
jgi:hypothetical protein